MITTENNSETKLDKKFKLSVKIIYFMSLVSFYAPLF